MLTVLGFPDAFLAADAVPQVLEHGPIGLEGFDALLLEFMRRKGLSPRDLPLLPEAGGHLLVEMGAWTAAEAQAKAEALVRAAQSWPTPPVARIYSADQAARVWHVRESALGSTVFVPGEPEGWEGWEDAGIPPVHLGNYLRKLTALMAEYGYRSPLYGHYGQGCVHLRINFDFRTEQGLRNFREFLDRAADLVLSFGGSLSGEHGDGQARAALLPKMFGPELMQAFREFKALWDPDNRMNPGKLIDAVRVYDPVENLRHHLRWGQLPSAGPRQKEGAGTETNSAMPGAPGPAFGTWETTKFPSDRSALKGHDFSRAEQTTTKSGALAPERAVGPPETPTREAQSAAPQVPQSPALQVLETHFAFAADHGSFERATERCVGVGACRKAEGGVMCPSYRATGQEQHSTRGRARLLWEMLAGALREEGFQSHAVHEALDLCLSCKACKTECPVQVDMAAYKSEFLAQRYKGRLHPLHHYIFGFADKLARYGSLAPALTNALLTGPLTSPLIKRIAGVAQQRALPKLAQHSYQHSRVATDPRAPSIRHLSGEWVGDHDASARTAQLAPPQVASASSVSGHDFSRAEETANKNRALAPARTPGVAEISTPEGQSAPPQVASASSVSGHDFSRAEETAHKHGALAPGGIPGAPSIRPSSGEWVGNHDTSGREAQLAAPQVPGGPGLDVETWETKNVAPPLAVPSSNLGATSFPLPSAERVGEHDLSAREAQLAAPQVPQLAPPQVVLWPDTWNNYYHPQTLAAAETVLTQAGFRVETPTGHICCGRPLYDFGLLDAARAYLAKVLDRMAPQIDAGLPFIFLEPSCASVFKDELLELFPNDPRARRLSLQTWLLADWLAANAPDFATGRLAGAHILIHGHCHHKAVFGGPASEIALLRQAGATVESIQAGCCGMAGPFGFEASKFEVSKAIAQDGLLPAVESAGPMTILVADGFSCREQIDQLGHKQALHFAEVLARTCGCSG